jgi:hypothetical protein
MFVSGGSLVTTKTPLSLTDPSSSYWPSMPPMSNGWPSAYAGIYRRSSGSTSWSQARQGDRSTAAAGLPPRRPGPSTAGRAPDGPLLRSRTPACRLRPVAVDVVDLRHLRRGVLVQAARRRRRGRGPLPAPPVVDVLDERTQLWTFDNGKLRSRTSPTRTWSLPRLQPRQPDPRPVAARAAARDAGERVERPHGDVVVLERGARPGTACDTQGTTLAPRRRLGSRRSSTTSRPAPTTPASRSCSRRAWSRSR